MKFSLFGWTLKWPTKPQQPQAAVRKTKRYLKEKIKKIFNINSKSKPQSFWDLPSGTVFQEVNPEPENPTDNPEEDSIADSDSIASIASILIYNTLVLRHRQNYTTRDRFMPSPNRHIFRGAWCIVNMAIQFCPDNPRYTLSEEDLIMRSDIRFEEFMFYAIDEPLPRPYIEYYEQYDTKPTPGYFWHLIASAVMNPQLFLVPAALELVRNVWCNEDPEGILFRIGFPRRTMSEEDFEELRTVLGELVFPDLER